MNVNKDVSSSACFILENQRALVWLLTLCGRLGRLGPVNIGHVLDETETWSAEFLGAGRSQVKPRFLTDASIPGSWGGGRSAQCGGGRGGVWVSALSRCQVSRSEAN